MTIRNEGVEMGKDAIPWTDYLIPLPQEIEGVVAVAKAQTAVWTTIPRSTAELFDSNTTDYWRSLERNWRT
jgi:hypothetical protein